jgi:hypothetical protein
MADRRIELLGGRDLEPLHPPGQRVLAIGLDEQVDVGALDAEVNDPEILALRRRDRGFADRLIHAATAQVTDGSDHAQHDVHRVPGIERRPLLVRRACPLALRWPTRTSTLATARLPQYQLLELTGAAPLT